MIDQQFPTRCKRWLQTYQWKVFVFVGTDPQHQIDVQPTEDSWSVKEQFGFEICQYRL